MQGSNILDGFSKKMIKEDHYLACTTKMFEIYRTRRSKAPGCVRHHG
jgi:hypothetical protein